MTKEKSSPLEPFILRICPLIGIIKDQTEEAETLGLQACNLSNVFADFKLLESMNLVFASAEAATDDKFLNYLKSDASFTNCLLACIADESHIVYTWYGFW